MWKGTKWVINEAKNVQLILNENIQQKNGVMLHSIMLKQKKKNQTEIVIVICAMKLWQAMMQRQRLCW